MILSMIFGCLIKEMILIFPSHVGQQSGLRSKGFISSRYGAQARSFFVAVMFFRKRYKKTMLITANTIKMTAMDISSVMPLAFVIMTIPARATVRIMTKTSRTGARIYPNRRFFINNMAVRASPGRAMDRSRT
jgi:hypothetical protein